MNYNDITDENDIMYRGEEKGEYYPIYKGETLDFDTGERVKTGLKKYYAITTFFGAFLFWGITISAINFIVGVFTDEAFNEGTFVYPIAKIIMLVVTIPFFLIFMYLTSKLMLIGKKATDKISRRNFWWRNGVITKAEEHRYRTNKRTRTSYIYEANGEQCEILEQRVQKGDRVIIVYLGAETKGTQKGNIVFAIPTENKINL